MNIDTDIFKLQHSFNSFVDAFIDCFRGRASVRQTII